MAKKNEVWKSFEHLFEPRQSDFVNDAVAVDIFGDGVKGDNQAEFLGGLEHAQHRVGIPGDAGGQFTDALAAEFLVLAQEVIEVLDANLAGMARQPRVHVAKGDKPPRIVFANPQDFPNALGFRRTFRAVERQNHGHIHPEPIHHRNLVRGGHEGGGVRSGFNLRVCVNMGVHIDDHGVFSIGSGIFAYNSGIKGGLSFWRRRRDIIVVRKTLVMLGFVITLAPHGWAANVEAQEKGETMFLNNGVTAHRGNAGAFPENTLAAFKSALAVGADWIELDICRTKDGKLAVLHDSTTKRVGDKDLAVAEVSYAELREVDVAHAFRTENGLTVEQCPPARAPLLSEVLALIQCQRRTRLSIQPKMAAVDDAVRLVKEMGAEAWAGFNDGDLKKMRRVKELAPELHVFWDRGAPKDLDADLKTARQHGFESLVIHHKGITKEVADAIHGAGIEAGAWTVNDAAEMRRLLQCGVDRMYTDFPARLLAIRKEMGLSE